MTTPPTDAQRIEVAIQFISSCQRDTQLLVDYNEMIVNILVLLVYSQGNFNATKTAAESLFLLGYSAGKVSGGDGAGRTTEPWLWD